MPLTRKDHSYQQSPPYKQYSIARHRVFLAKAPYFNNSQPQIRLYSGIGQNLEKCALLKLRELRAARFVRKFLYKNSYAPKAACICELLLGFFEKCAKRSAQYQKLYFDCDIGLYKMRKERKDVRPSSLTKQDLGLIDLAYR